MHQKTRSNIAIRLHVGKLISFKLCLYDGYIHYIIKDIAGLFIFTPVEYDIGFHLRSQEAEKVKRLLTLSFLS